MYQRHFGLKEAPFGITPNPSFFYSGNTRGALLEALLYAVEQGEGIVKVTGEVGTGKTMLCRMLEDRLAPQVDIAYLADPALDRREVVYTIAAEFGVDTHGLRFDEVERALQHALIARHAEGRRAVLLVEEAQAMPLETLEQIRLLSNLETARDKLLQIVLFGQPELDAHIDLPAMRQLRERITHNFTVPAMPRDLVPDFLAFRLRAAGCRGRHVFTPRAARRIARASHGIVRRINILADKALMAAYADGAECVEASHARRAIADCGYLEFPSFSMLALGVVLLCGALALIIT